MELVTSLTKEDCLFAIKRFISRRGMTEKILTDNETNFLGARSDLIKLKALLDKDDTGNSLVNFVNERNCEWLTIPPRAPHFGGLWEAAIKSMKRHMRRVKGLKVLSVEVFLTIINQIEAILNSRPLVALSNDRNDPVALTPAHFLIGGSMLAAPQGESEDANINTRYKLLKKLQDEFWRMWKRDYLTELQILKKWFSNGPEFRIGDLILLAEDNKAPMQWKTGRVLEVYKGNDGTVRVCKVKTSNSTFIRPVVKLRKLPVNPDLKPGSTAPSVGTSESQ